MYIKNIVRLALSNSLLRSGSINYTKALLKSSPSFLEVKQVSPFHLSPANCNKEKTSIRQNEFVFEPSNLLPADEQADNYQHLFKQIPVVCIFGWTGSHDKNLGKFSQIYTDLGYHTIRISPSFGMVFATRPYKHKDYTEKLLQLMRDQYGLAENKIFVHIISNAGACVFLQNVVDIHDSVYVSNDRALDVKDISFFGKNQVGTLFDSCVGLNTSYRTLIEGVAGSVSGSALIKYAVGVSIASFVWALLPFFPNNYYVRGFKKCTMDRRQLPSLFIYSTGDKLIDPAQIAKLCALKRETFPGMYIKQAVFEDAEHVLIYKKYPEQYVELIKEHLKVCDLDMTKINLK